MPSFPSAHGFWPSPEQELLLRAACLPPEPALASWRTWREERDFKALDAGSHRLLPLAYENLKHQPLGADLAVLKGLSREYLRQFTLLSHAVAEPLRALESAGLQPLLLKGLPLALRHYPAPYLRPMADCDILVRPGDAGEALRILGNLGWKHPGFCAFATAATCEHPRGFSIDLHQNAFFQCPYDRQDEALWERAVPLVVAGVQTQTLSATDHLYYVAVHGLRWDPVPPVRWVADLMMLLRSSEGINWSQLVQTARRRELIWPIYDALEYLHLTLVAPVPEAVLDELAARPLSWLDRRERMAWSRPPEMTDGFWIKYARYRRLRRNGAREYQVSPATFFRDAWKLDHTTELPAMVLNRAQVKLEERKSRA